MLEFVEVCWEFSKKPRLGQLSKTSKFEVRIRTEFLKSRIEFWRFFEAKPQNFDEVEVRIFEVFANPIEK